MVDARVRFAEKRSPETDDRMTDDATGVWG